MTANSIIQLDFQDGIQLDFQDGIYVNFFQPVLKLVGKEQVNGKMIKTYDQPATPFRRVLASDLISPEIKANLNNVYVHINPVTLRNSIDQKVARLWKIVR